MDSKTILAVVLSLAVLMVYQIFFAPTPQKQTAPVQESTQASIDTATKSAAPQATKATTKSATKMIVSKNEAAPKDIKVETDNYTAIFSTKGAALKSFQLKGYQNECTECTDDIYPKIKNFVTGQKQQPKEKSKALIEVVTLNESMPYPLAITFPESAAEAVSYTHLTLPTKRIV